MQCKQCGGAIKPNMEKLKVIGLTSAAIAGLGLVMGTPTGWIALLTAPHWTPQMRNMLRIKLEASRASQNAGEYFECGSCGKGVGIFEVISLL